MVSLSWKLDGGDTWVTPVMQRTVEEMRAKNLTIIGFRDRRGKLRYIMSDNQLLHAQTVEGMKRRGLLEQLETIEEANRKNEVHYRLKVAQ